MLGWAGTKKFFPFENVRWGWYKKPPLSQYVRRGSHKKDLFTENIKRGLYKKAPLTQYLRRGWHKKVLFAENISRGMCVGICFNLIC